jgi:hypothetical protein
MKYNIGTGGLKKNIGLVGSNLANNSTRTNEPKSKVGKVYGVVTTENTPTKKQFERVGGFSAIGTIFYKDYHQSKRIPGNLEDEFFEGCLTARPLYTNTQHFPMRGELVVLNNSVSPSSQENNAAGQIYYSDIVNLWGNQQQNSQPTNENEILDIDFIENSNIRPLLSFAGDYIVQGRQGNALRFSTTSKYHGGVNEWSSIGNGNDPITILTNGFSYDPSGSFHVEKINLDNSSLYLTSYQSIPLIPDKNDILNPITNPISIKNYTSPQAILNSDRIILNSKKDEVMIFAKTNIELNTKNTINLNSDTSVHLNTETILLGKGNEDSNFEPLLLGNKTVDLLLDLTTTLYQLGADLSAAISMPEGAPLLDVNIAAESLMNDIENKINPKIIEILSLHSYTL